MTGGIRREKSNCTSVRTTVTTQIHRMMSAVIRDYVVPRRIVVSILWRQDILQPLRRGARGYFLKTWVLQQIACETVAKKPVVSSWPSRRLALADFRLDHVESTYEPSVAQPRPPSTRQLVTCMYREGCRCSQADIIWSCLRAANKDLEVQLWVEVCSGATQEQVGMQLHATGSTASWC